jgi:anti-anti-sigma factor
VRQPLVIAPEGEIDLERVGEFRANLTRARGKGGGVAVDLSRVSFIDSSGLGAIVELYNRARRDDQWLGVVIPAGRAVAVRLNLSGLQTRVPIYRTGGRPRSGLRRDRGRGRRLAQLDGGVALCAHRGRP